VNVDTGEIAAIRGELAAGRADNARLTRIVRALGILLDEVAPLLYSAADSHAAHAARSGGSRGRHAAAPRPRPARRCGR
jgi:hypothetical protein